MKQGLILSFLFCTLAGCNQNSNFSADYLNRLERVLERKAPSKTVFKPLTFPESRQLAIKLPEASLSIREFLSLRECKLHTTIAHRNSSLGKVASASQQLFSDLQILHLGPACVKQLSDNNLAKKLEQFLQQKEANLGTTLWYSIIAQQEYASFWRNNNNDNYPTNLKLETIPDVLALAEFTHRVLQGQRFFTRQQTNQIERHLGNLRFGDGGQLLTHYQQLADNLERANSVIRQRIASPLCLQKRPTQQARFLSNVVNTHFIKTVQANAVMLNQRAKKLEFAMSKLEKPLFDYAHQAYKQWFQQRDMIVERGKASTKQHAQLLQQLYLQCGLKPGN